MKMAKKPLIPIFHEKRLKKAEMMNFDQKQSKCPKMLKTPKKVAKKGVYFLNSDF